MDNIDDLKLKLAAARARAVAAKARAVAAKARAVAAKARADPAEARVAPLEKQVAELLEKLNRNSGNSNRPPAAASPTERLLRRAREQAREQQRNRDEAKKKGGGPPPQPTANGLHWDTGDRRRIAHPADQGLQTCQEHKDLELDAPAREPHRPGQRAPAAPHAAAAEPVTSAVSLAGRRHEAAQELSQVLRGGSFVCPQQTRSDNSGRPSRLLRRLISAPAARLAGDPERMCARGGYLPRCRSVFRWPEQITLTMAFLAR